MSSLYVSLEEVRRHDRENDCWIVVHSKIYDITDYIPSHPGGSAIILNYAGRDATAAYEDIHAPGLIEEQLGPRHFKGRLSMQDELALQQSRCENGQKATESGSLLKPLPQDKSRQEEASAPPLDNIISLADFEAAARKILPRKGWAFYSSAADDLVTHRMNIDFFRRIMFRPRLMRNVAHADCRAKILGHATSAPFFASPAAMARLAHPEGELDIARGCAEQGIIQCISSNASYPLKAITEATRKDHPIFFQLYVNTDRLKSTDLLKRLKPLGVSAVFVTVDNPKPGKREADQRAALESNVARAPTNNKSTSSKKPQNIGIAQATGQYIDASLEWRDIAWIKKTSGLPVVIKGIQCAADAKLALKHGCHGIFVSNHGARNLDTSQPAILTLLELNALCPEVFQHMEVFVDGGISRGGDVVKCLALGATAVGLGRPFLYALCYGSEGIQHLCQILKEEILTCMKLCGINSVDQASPDLLNTSDIDHLVPRTFGHPWIASNTAARSKL